VSAADRTLLVTVTGQDRPGVTARLFAALSGPGVVVLDLEQVVVRGHLTLAVLVTAGRDEGRVMAAVSAAGRELGMRVTCAAGTGDNAPRPAGRLHVALIGRPLQPVAVAEIAGRIADHGANIDRVRRLSRDPVTTVEFDVSGSRPAELRRELAATASRLGVDVAVSPAGLARRGRRLVVLDVDSTLIRDEVIELLAEHAGRGREVAEVTERAMRGEIDFAASLHERVACLAGLDADVVHRVREAVRLTPGARTLCRTLHRLGFTLGLVSGGFAEVVEPLAASLGISLVRANRLEVAGGRLTGRVLGDVVDRAGKAAALREFAAAEGLPLARTVAIGDGANDLDMLAAAGLGIAFNAKPVVREQADAAVSLPYLDTVLYLLGISREEVEDADAADAAAASVDGRS
jgi:phosphoserine phosphatase